MRNVSLYRGGEKIGRARVINELERAGMQYKSTLTLVDSEKPREEVMEALLDAFMGVRVNLVVTDMYIVINDRRAS